MRFAPRPGGASCIEMRYKIKEIDEEGLALDLPLGTAWLEQECPGLDARPGPQGLRLTATLERSGEDFLLRGTLRGVLETPCARCLEPARVALDVPLVVTFVERGQGEGEGEGDDDLDVAGYEGDEIDLGTELRDQVLLAMPITPLCREQGAGLCPVCGGNRNQKPCDCEERQNRATSKLAALAKLKLQ